MQNNTEAQKKRRKGALQGALTFSFFCLLSAGLCLFLRQYVLEDRVGSAVLLAIGVLDLGMMLPVWILYKKRLDEIQGGEEDAAAQY